LQPGLDWVARSTRRVTPSFSFPYFFFNPDRFQPQVNPPGRAEFQNYDKKGHSMYSFFF
jgi:hypothetical protein